MVEVEEEEVDGRMTMAGKEGRTAGWNRRRKRVWKNDDDSFIVLEVRSFSASSMRKARELPKA